MTIQTTGKNNSILADNTQDSPPNCSAHVRVDNASVLFSDSCKSRFSLKNTLGQWALIVSVGVLLASPVHAEAPMNTDDASTLDQGGKKIEGTWLRDGRQRGGEVVFGFSPLKNLEIGVTASDAKENGNNRDDQLRGVGFSAKWVPYQNETGWSLGASFNYGHTRITDNKQSALFTEQEYALTGLASYHLKNGQVLHINLGMARTESQDERNTVGTWGIGYEIPLLSNLQLTVETFGAEHSGPDKAIGLRYKIVDGLKISGAVGHGNDRNFGQLGFAWEF